MNVDRLIDGFLRANGRAGDEGPNLKAEIVLFNERERKRRMLLPWQRDVLSLVGDERDQLVDVPATGPWQWAKIVILDGQVNEALTTLQALLTRLAQNGEQFTIDAFRPKPVLSWKEKRSMAIMEGAPRPYRFVIVTWGGFLGMDRQEIASEMLRRYHHGAGDTDQGSAAADGSPAPA